MDAYFQIGDKFSTFVELKEKLAQFEQTFFVDLHVVRSKTVESISKYRKGKLKAELKYYHNTSLVVFMVMEAERFTRNQLERENHRKCYDI